MHQQFHSQPVCIFHSALIICFLSVFPDPAYTHFIKLVSTLSWKLSVSRLLIKAPVLPATIQKWVVNMAAEAENYESFRSLRHTLFPGILKHPHLKKSQILLILFVSVSQMDCTCVAVFESIWPLKVLSHYISHSPIQNTTVLFVLIIHTHIHICTYVGNVGFSVPRTLRHVTRSLESNHQPSDSQATALSPELQPPHFHRSVSLIYAKEVYDWDMALEKGTHPSSIPA